MEKRCEEPQGVALSETFNTPLLVMQPHATRPKTTNCTKKDQNPVTKETKSIDIREMFNKIASNTEPKLKSEKLPEPVH